MSTVAIIVAAGRGTRAGEGPPKQWRDLRGQPVLAHTLAAFRAVPEVDRLLVVLHPDDIDRAHSLLGPGVETVTGGATRDASVRAALEALADSDAERVLIQDGARPFAGPRLIRAVLAALEHHDAAAPALPVSDALWSGEAGRVTGLVPREGLFRAQTPQGFRFPAILDAHRAHPGGAADDVAVALAHGLDVAITEGDEDNIKLTYPGDFLRAGRILKGPDMDIRSGNGFDVHAFAPGDHLWLCGVKLPHDKTLKGHSDADVGMHALTDAIYGALAEGDIGRHFPPSDPQWKGAASHIFLAHAAEVMRGRGYRLGNADVTLMCERPKIGPHAGAMQAELARILGIEPGRISVKATTTERLGFTGREEGIAALATAVLIRD